MVTRTDGHAMDTRKDKPQTAEIRQIMSQIDRLNFGSKMVVHKLLTDDIRVINLFRVADEIEKCEKQGNYTATKRDRDDIETNVLLRTRSQTSDEGEAIARFIEFARSTILKHYVEFAEIAILFQDVHAKLKTEHLSEPTMKLFCTTCTKFFTTLTKVAETCAHTTLPRTKWIGLHGLTPTEYDKFVGRWKKIRDKLA